MYVRGWADDTIISTECVSIWP